MTIYDLCLAWNWPYDADFVALLEAACRERGLSVLQVTPETLETALQQMASGELAFRATLNRASDTDPRFLPLIQLAQARGVFRLNPREREERAADKATMHLEFITAGLNTPYTIILSPFAEQPGLPPLDLSPLGASFAIKPAHGGGGAGVICEATSLDQVYAARQQHPTDKYLLQAHVTPTVLQGRPAWFRVIYCSGQVYPCWWDTHTRVYTPVTDVEETELGLTPLREMTLAIGRVNRLHLFSTEIARTAAGQFLAVDYVNDQIDLRLQSQAVDGVPDVIVRDIANRLADVLLAVKLI